MPTTTQLQHYLREVMRSAVYEPTAKGVHAYVPEIVGMQVDAATEREAEQELLIAVGAQIVNALDQGRTLPEVGGVDLNTSYARNLLHVEHGIVTEVPERFDAVRTLHDAVAQEYVTALRDLEFIDAVYVEGGPESVRLYTLFHGPRDAVSPVAYSAQGRIHDTFPDAPVSFELIEADLVDRASLERVARQAFLRA